MKKRDNEAKSKTSSIHECKNRGSQQTLIIKRVKN